MKKFFYIILILIMTLITSCQEEELPITTIINPSSPIQLRVALNFEKKPSRYYLIQDKIKQFTAKYPNIQVELVRIPETNRGYNALISDIGSLPDIIELNQNQVRLSLKDRVEDLSSYMAMEIERSTITNDSKHSSPWSGTYSHLIDAARVDGEMYLVPVRSDQPTFFYNKSLFRDLSIPDPAEGWTWEQFIECSRTLRSNNQFTFFSHVLEDIETFIKGLGGSYSSSDLAHFHDYLDSDATVTAFKKLSQTPLFYFFEENYNSNDAHPYGMGFTQPGSISITYDQLTNTDDYAIAPMPTFNNEAPSISAHIAGLSISKSSTHKEAAWELIKFIIGETDDDAQQFVASNTIIFGDERFYTRPHPNQRMLIDRLIKDISSVVPSTLYMTTNSIYYDRSLLDYYHYYDETKDYKSIFQGMEVKSSLEKLAKEIEDRLAAYYVKT